MHTRFEVYDMIYFLGFTSGCLPFPDISNVNETRGLILYFCDFPKQIVGCLLVEDEAGGGGGGGRS